MVGEPLIRGPGLLDDGDAFVKALGRLLDRDAEGLEFRLAVALADAKIEPAARE
jgi:hypothetical protein